MELTVLDSSSPKLTDPPEGASAKLLAVAESSRDPPRHRGRARLLDGGSGAVGPDVVIPRAFPLRTAPPTPSTQPAPPQPVGDGGGKRPRVSHPRARRVLLDGGSGVHIDSPVHEHENARHDENAINVKKGPPQITPTARA